MARSSDRRNGERRKAPRRAATPAPARATSEPAIPTPSEVEEKTEPEPERREQSDRRGAERREVPRREAARVTTVLRVDYRCEDNFLYAFASNVSMLGIFLQTNTPHPPGTPVELIFDAEDDGFAVQGTVAWVNPYKEGGVNTNPGMGIRFLDVDVQKRERLVRLVRRIAYLGTDSPSGQA